jgi:hypothetical protein
MAAEGDKYVPVDVPGLIGTEPLDFLAAIGLADMMNNGGLLSWSPEDYHAILHCDETEQSDLGAVVYEAAHRLRSIEPGKAIPYSPRFPYPRRPQQADPLRMRPAEFREKMDARQREGTSWLKATLTDQETDENGFCALTPFIALRGRQTIGSFWYYPMMEVAKAPRRLLTEALRDGTRVEGVDSWLLDHRAEHSHGRGIRGPAGSLAVPGKIWLATLAIHDFPFESRYVPGAKLQVERPIRPVLWNFLDGQDIFMWPLWTLPMGRGTRGSLFHVGWHYRDWQLTRQSDGLHVQISDTHGASAPHNFNDIVDAGIFTMCAATRPLDGPQPGPLTPLPIETSRQVKDGRSAKKWRYSQNSTFVTNHGPITY